MWPHGIYLSNVTFGNKTHFVCFQPEPCCVRIYALGRRFDISQKLTARAWVRGSGRGLTWPRRWMHMLDHSCRRTHRDRTRDRYFQRATVTNMEGKANVSRCFCQARYYYRALHGCSSEKDQQGDILSRQMDPLAQLGSQLSLFLFNVYRTFNQNTHVDDELSMTWTSTGDTLVNLPQPRQQ